MKIFFDNSTRFLFRGHLAKAVCFFHGKQVVSWFRRRLRIKCVNFAAASKMSVDCYTKTRGIMQ